MTMGDRKISLFSDTGSRYTVIPLKFYHPKMGKLLKTNTTLRAWGSKYSLDVRGMFHTTLVTERGPGSTQWCTSLQDTNQRPYLEIWMPRIWG